MEATGKVWFEVSSKKALALLDRLAPLMLVTLAVLIILPGLGAGSLRDWDEAIYAQTAREMVQRGDWVTLYYGYKPFFEKPPLLIWITSFFFKLFGISEFWSRAASAISGTVLVWITYLSAKEVYDKRTGFLAGLILLGSYGFIYEARNGETDMLLSLFVATGIFAYLRLRNGNPKWWYLIWISCALAFMVKFWAGLVLPITLAALLLLERKTTATLHSRPFWLGLLVAAVLVLPWHIAVYMENGSAFLDIYITRDLVRRTITTMEGHYGSPLLYLDVLRRLFNPWYFLFPFALVIVTHEIFDRRWSPFILLAEILLIFGLYTFVVNTKNSSYIFPIFPAFAILTAHLFTLSLCKPRSIAFTCIIIASLLATTVLQDRLLVICLLVVIGLVILLSVNFLSKENFPLVFTSFIFVVFFLSSIISYVLGNHRLQIGQIYGRYISPVAQIAAFAGRNNPSNTEPIIGFALAEDLDTDFAVEGPTAKFYSNRPVDEAYTWDRLAELMKKDGSREILFAKKYLPQLSADYQILVVKEVDPLIYARISH